MKEEIRKNEERLRNRQLRKLRIETRPAELAKLYDARKSFELRLRTSKEKHVIVIKGREVRVQRELQRRAESGRGTGGMVGLDWDADITLGFWDDADIVVDKLLEEKLHNTREKEDDHDFADNEYFLGVELDENNSDTISGSEKSSIGSNGMFPQHTRRHSKDSSLAVSFLVASVEDRVKRRATAVARRKRKNLNIKR